jgi:predicted RNase H-like HicB family nuclease
MRLTAAVTKDGEWYVARCLEVEITSQGKTMEEALANLQQALELFFEDEMNIEPFTAPIIAPLEIEVGQR